LAMENHVDVAAITSLTADQVPFLNIQMLHLVSSMYRS
jgi:hypothetical protein